MALMANWHSCPPHDHDGRRSRRAASAFACAAFALSFAVASTASTALARPGAAGSPARPPDDGSSAAAAQARPARAMSLREVLDAVVQQNPELARSLVDVTDAEADALAAQGADDWTVLITGTWSSSRSEFIEGQPFQTLSNDTFALSAGLSRGLSTGGTVSFTLDGSYSDTTFAVIAEDPTMPFEFEAGAVAGGLTARITQPLLAGRGARIARADRRRAKVARDAATLRREIAALDTIREVVRAYWEVAYASRAVAIRRGAVELARAQLAITEAAVRGQVAAPAELLAVRHAIAVREQAVMLAETEVSDRSLALRRLAGLEIGPGEIDIAVTEAGPAPATAPDATPGPPPETVDLDAVLARAMEHNPRLALARTGAESAAIDIELAEDALRPRLDLNAHVGPSGNAIEAGDTLRQIGTVQAFTVGAGLTYTSSIGERTARGARERARGEATRARIDIEAVRRELAVAVVRAVDLARVAKKRIEVSRLEVELAEQNLANERVLVEAGEARNFDILERQDELAVAQLGLARALADYRQAVAELDALTGELLSRHGVELLDVGTAGGRVQP